ncbi:hypothetical protein [Hydrogenophaga laconesensis]|uniref:Uncharacterized protein n=1 Tax=Hydrogenophaga laconesensis TaxID=1805971 RepID=A0ABU1VEA1_9BURK|nr:hypothetical protein [Hydrogenophaga laconesensis]MDR7095518.1 hypothetical protein [Hydrogenophaga laconesensis]
MPDPVIVECASACTVTLQLETTGPFHLTVADGLVLSGLVVSLWFAGFGIRALMAVLKGNSDG